MVETTTMSEAELASQPQGQSEPGAGESMAGETGKQPPSSRPAGRTGRVDDLRRSDLWFQHWLPEWLRRPAAGCF